MTTKRLGLIMNGVTGRMGLNQHLIRSIVAIRDQGGVLLANGDRVMPDPILVGRDAEKVAALAKRFNIARSTTRQNAWPMAMWPSWMFGVEALGVTSATSHIAANSAPLAPVMPITVISSLCAARTARRMLSERPLVVIATSTSPGAPMPSSWRENTWS